MLWSKELGPHSGPAVGADVSATGAVLRGCGSGMLCHMNHDPHRPRYHFVIPERCAYPADPNGAIYWRGRYHLMYIYQDPALPHGGHCWGHASSADLISWTHHPPAIVPRPGDADVGSYSGNAFVNLDGDATILYHGCQAGNCIATSDDDDLISWRKLATNPIVPKPPEDHPDAALYSSWDPHGWVEDGRYYAVFGGQLGSGAPATLFIAGDLAHWEYQGPFLTRDLPDVDEFEDVSCPDFFTLGDRHALLCISHARGCRLYLGAWNGRQFNPQEHIRMNWPGGACFAPESLLAPDGRRIFWAWALDPRANETVQAAGWSGVMTLPRELDLPADGVLRVRPAREVEQLRGEPIKVGDVTLVAGKQRTIPEIQGDDLELQLDMQMTDDAVAGVAVRCSPDGQEQTVILCDVPAGEVRIDLARSTADASVIYPQFIIGRDDAPPVTSQAAPYAFRADGSASLRILIDRSILDIFIDQRLCLTQRIFPMRPDSLGIALVCLAGQLHRANLTAWRMRPLAWLNSAIASR